MDNHIDALTKALREGTRQERLDVLREMGASAFDPLNATLHSADAGLRRTAATMLGDLRDARAVPALIEALEHDSEGEVRLWAAYSLRSMPDTRSIEPLLNALSDTDAGMRETVIRTLGTLLESFESPRALNAIHAALHDDDWGTRQSAAEMLLRIGEDESGEAEGLLLADLSSVDGEIALGAAWSLLELGDERAFDTLVKLLGHRAESIAGMAAHGLGLLGDERAIVPLEAATRSTNEHISEAAHNALRRLKSSD